MANRKNTFLLKRSNVPDKIPPLSGLTMGEVALNTADAKMYTVYTSGDTTPQEVRQIGWDRIHRTGDTVTGDFIFNGDITITGTSKLNTVTASTISNVDYIDFDITETNNTAEGRLFWDFENGTLNLGMGGGNVTQQIGEDTYYFVKNQTGSQINRGQVVRAAGTVGNSGRILVDLAVADGSIPDKFIMGVAAENIPNGEDGLVNEFGLIKGVNTTGSLYSETWVNGTVLYVSPTTPGGLTSVEPSSPNQKIIVALVISANANGSLFVRPTFGSYMKDIYNVQTSGETNGDLLIYNSGTTTWEYSKTLNGNYNVNGSLSATTFFGDGSNLTGISTVDNFTTGATISGNTIIFNRTDLSNAYNVDLTPIVSGFTNFDTFVTGFTYNNNTFTISQNSGSTLSANISIMTGLTVNGQTLFSGSSDNVVTIVGSGSTNPLFTISGSSGELFSVTDNLTGDLLSVNNINSEPILIVRDDNTVLFGVNPTLSLNTTINVTVSAGTSEVLFVVPSGYTSSYFDYNVSNSIGVRAGNVMGIWSASTIQYAEVSTNSIGNTSDIDIYMEMSGATALLRCSATTYNWDVKSIVRLI
jgi:hypothetical protein